MVGVTALFKNGDKNCLSNYRPVSILPIFSKGLEKLMPVRLSKFIAKYSVLSICQYGFRQMKSSKMALLAQKEIIARALDIKLLALGVFIDFSKAFDYVNHTVLLKKTQDLWCPWSIRSIYLIKSYLGNRKQYVKINSGLSSAKEV